MLRDDGNRKPSNLRSDDPSILKQAVFEGSDSVTPSLKYVKAAVLGTSALKSTVSLTSTTIVIMTISSGSKLPMVTVTTFSSVSNEAVPFVVDACRMLKYERIGSVRITFSKI